MTTVTTLGFPRIGIRRELKQTLEAYWQGRSDRQAVLDTALALRHRHWQQQRDAGADVVPCNDFSLYDHVLDTAFLFDAIPDAYRALADADPLAGYFALARGLQRDGHDLRALEMTKWFDTNYHYLVPELHRDQRFALRGDKPVAEFLEAKKAGHDARPVLLGPVSFLLLSKTVDGSDRLALLDRLLPAYAALLERLRDAGAEWVQVDEPCLALDATPEVQAAYERAYRVLRDARRPKLMLTAWFESLGENTELVARLPVDGLHLDLVRGKAQLDRVLRAGFSQAGDGRVLSLGLVDGRNIWRANLDDALVLAKYAATALGRDRVQIAPSCSLLHVPIDLRVERGLPEDIVGWLAFALQKIGELRTLVDALDDLPQAADALQRAREAQASRRASPKVHRPEVAARVAGSRERISTRHHAYTERKPLQSSALGLPSFPTTTIGSFPQTPDVREMRAKFKSGKVARDAYDTFIAAETEACIRFQEEVGLDMLVHGEFERNDMVEYFGELLDGFVFTRSGWVQSYGTRCVKPPILFGDVVRPEPMTVRWSAHAQSLTDKPVKGMLTGPVTILRWSFVRDDLPHEDVCRQLALVLADEVLDLEKAGIRAIQIDEPAFREGLPLRRDAWDDYLRWAVDCFRLTCAEVAADTQIHTHMCYSEFNDIIDAIAAMDADVISIETSRSRMELLDAFAKFRYPNDIGPGVYDIHSPRVPDGEEMRALVDRARDVVPAAQLWVNPDCGLKTRQWPETRAALEIMVGVARGLRAEAQPMQAATGVPA
ncbi:MAG: 5-methyltetrahydropteroyltriglutamate--homocysteine S-methyltransferase [Xanthomonadaceae bacterium]|nr:5-methyltetrahydropteroyltriglutamate--homocysteine S-methyltransferase [Xanthomonadaceae bacterium]